ncbi:MAG: PEP-CTERM sorting domain-containing protein [Cyanobacteria bacterium P01_H01_bin.58]
MTNTFARLSVALILPALVLTIAQRRAQAATVTIGAAADGFVQSSDVLGLSTGDAEANIRTSRSGPNNIRQGVYEFDLAGVIPDTGIITSARLLLTTSLLLSNTPNNPTVDIRLDTYVGDGAVSTDDFDADEASGGSLVSQGSFPYGTPANGGTLEGTLLEFVLSDLELLANVAAADGFIGYRTETDDFATFRVASSESSELAGPQLEINFEATEPVPEPLTILGSVTAIGMGIFLKKKQAT